MKRQSRTTVDNRRQFMEFVQAEFGEAEFRRNQQAGFDLNHKYLSKNYRLTKIYGFKKN